MCLQQSKVSARNHFKGFILPLENSFVLFERFRVVEEDMDSNIQLGINKIQKADGVSCSFHKLNKTSEFLRAE